MGFHAAKRSRYTAGRDGIVDLDADFLDDEWQNPTLNPPGPGAP